MAMSCRRAVAFVSIFWCGVAFAADGPASELARIASDVQSLPAVDQENVTSGVAEIMRGREIFRFDTFGDEAFWGGKLGLHRAIAGQANGGIGAGLSPKAALELGLKVDVNALPTTLRNDLRNGRVDLTNPA